MPRAIATHRSPVRLPTGDQLRGSAAKRGYDRVWQRVRADHLRQEPLCRFCAQDGRVTPAEVVDHIEEIARRPDLRLNHGNLRSLCKECHDRRTGQARRTGRPDG